MSVAGSGTAARQRSQWPGAALQRGSAVSGRERYCRAAFLLPAATAAAPSAAEIVTTAPMVAWSGTAARVTAEQRWQWPGTEPQQPGKAPHREAEVSSLPQARRGGGEDCEVSLGTRGAKVDI
ncbi:hypothetical protein scyTo_0013829 [Scyliorhinus torazame]|uniref:Uncharacterized protein n=1 Tax=Scyliorhinus torazame TaxID=75743 RepID=A0A401P5M5_SCYTO|nr:hypothetical protein [Scyliorhinus torazame]